MSNKLRRVNLTKRKQNSFRLGQSITDMVIPNYNALRDPFLCGFFQHPQMLSNLKRTGIISKKKSFSLQKYKEMVTDPKLVASTEKQFRRRKVKSEPKRGQAKKIQIDQGRIWMKSQQQTRPKVFRSVNMPLIAQA